MVEIVEEMDPVEKMGEIEKGKTLVKTGKGR